MAQSLPATAVVQILATDIDTQVLEAARNGICQADARGPSTKRLRRHFLKGTGGLGGKIRIKPELARLVRFAQFNLMKPFWDFTRKFDIVFCRNVMIDFDAATQRQLLQRMHQVLAPGGLLCAGHSESFSASADLFRLRGQTVYQRV